MPMRRSGSRIVPITNDLLRTIASNSRLNTANDLDMDSLDFADEVLGRADSFQEDLLEGRLAEFESLQSNASLHECNEQLLRIRVRREHDVRIGTCLPHT